MPNIFYTFGWLHICCYEKKSFEKAENLGLGNEAFDQELGKMGEDEKGEGVWNA